MTVKDIMRLIADTDISIKDRRTGTFVSRVDFKNHLDRKVVGIYPRVHRNGRKYNANLVLMVR